MRYLHLDENLHWYIRRSFYGLYEKVGTNYLWAFRLEDFLFIMVNHAVHKPFLKAQDVAWLLVGPCVVFTDTHKSKQYKWKWVQSTQIHIQIPQHQRQKTAPFWEPCNNLHPWNNILTSSFFFLSHTPPVHPLVTWAFFCYVMWFLCSWLCTGCWRWITGVNLSSFVCMNPWHARFSDVLCEND